MGDWRLATPAAFARDFRGFYRFMAWAWRPFMKSAEQAVETAVFLAASPDIEGVTGKHFVKKRPVSSSRASYDVALSRRLWQASAILTQQPAG